MDDNYRNWQLLATQIIIEIVEDYRDTRDQYKKEALIRWFDTGYGSTVCELAGMDPDYIKREVQHIEKHIRNDNQGTQKIYQTAGKESKYPAEGYNLQKEPDKKRDQQSNGGGDQLLAAFRYYQQKGKSCDWIPFSTKIRAAEESQRT